MEARISGSVVYSRMPVLVNKPKVSKPLQGLLLGVLAAGDYGYFRLTFERNLGTKVLPRTI